MFVFLLILKNIYLSSIKKRVETFHKITTKHTLNHIKNKIQFINK